MVFIHSQNYKSNYIFVNYLMPFLLMTYILHDTVSLLMKTATPHELIPDSVIESYAPSAPISIAILAGGIVNTTVLLTNHETEERQVVQKIHPIVDPIQTEDYAVISGHLRRGGWEVPLLIPTAQDELYHTDDTGAHWRAFEFIASDSNEKNPRIYYQKFEWLGALLGKLHLSLKEIDYEPKFKIPHFHDSEYYADTLEQALPELTDPDARSLATKALRKFVQLKELPKLPDQLIHADPKVENVLCRNTVPFTFIDWDTAMRGSPWTDLGDMVRSVEKGNGHNQKPLIGTYSLIDSYRLSANLDFDPWGFLRAGLRAGAAVTLELAMRYLIECAVDDNDAYFSWDRTAYSSRIESNLTRAHQSIQSHDLLSDKADINQEAMDILQLAKRC